MKKFKVFNKYPLYFLVGGCVTIATIMLRSLIGIFIQDDSQSRYIVSVILAYILGIGLSLVAQKLITFKYQHKLRFNQIITFVSIHLFGMILSLMISVFLRSLALDYWLPVQLSKSLAFTIAAFVVSLITYLGQKYLVFKKP